VGTVRKPDSEVRNRGESGVPRLVTVWCPEWPTIAAGIADDRPAAVFRANRVIACTGAARTAGVAHGDRRRAAQSACPELLVLDHDRDHDARRFEPIVRSVAELAPRVEVVEPGWLTVAARGPSRYFGGDASLAVRMIEMLAASAGPITVPVGVGIADGRAASAIAARLAVRRPDRVLVIAPGESTRFVTPLAIGWLRELGEIDADLVDLLLRLGIRTLGGLAELDPGDVLARFGPVGLHAHRLAGGLDRRPPATTDPPPQWWVEQPFDEPVEQLDTVVFVTKRLADELVSRLAEQGRVCVRLVIVIETEHGERCERAWYRDHGLSSSAIVERARWQLEGWASQPGGLSGGVALVRLMPDDVRSDTGVQSGLWGGRSQADADAARAVARLTGLAGEQAVTVPAWHGGRLPGERYRRVPAGSVDLDDPGGRLDRGEGPWPGSLPAPSPAWVADRPIPIDVFDADQRPVRVSGRGEVAGAPATVVIAGRQRGITAWAGPWPVEQHWWEPLRARRVARFQIVTDGGTAHLLAVEHQRWTLLATYS
jgi:protein ImuB